ncbi:MAG: hypothetical protein JWM85_3417 [Acidimicrobiaceae bacterium]|nr:hypothetical protein [Acidimicrobiaceae bacterium]
MQLLLLAAGHGRRFGGCKQLVAVGPNGELLLDYSVRAADAAGCDGVVVVVREEIREEMADHARRFWPAGLPREFMVQGAEPGTVPAVLAASGALDGSFIVANADDLYGDAAIAQAFEHLCSTDGDGDGGDQTSPQHHVLVGYTLANTVSSTDPVKRGICAVGADGLLVNVVEHLVRRLDGSSFEATPMYPEPGAAPQGPQIVSGNETVSMNLWGFRRSLLDDLRVAADEHRRGGDGATGELLLPEVVGRLVRERAEPIVVVQTPGYCIGLTHPADLPGVQAQLLDYPAFAPGLERRAAVSA